VKEETRLQPNVLPTSGGMLLRLSARTVIQIVQLVRPTLSALVVHVPNVLMAITLTQSIIQLSHIASVLLVAQLVSFSIQMLTAVLKSAQQEPALMPMTL